MSRPGQWLRLLTRDEQKIRKWLDLYIHHRNLYNKGEGEVGFLRSLFGVNTAMLAWLFVRDLWPQLPIWVLLVLAPILVAIKIALNWCVGWWWDKHKFFDSETTWNNKRNPVAKVLSQKILDGEGIDGGH